MRKYLNLLYNKEKRLYLDVYLPQSENFNVIVYFHGGGLEVGERNGENIVQIAQDFVKEGYGFVSADYSLYPSAKFPSYILDCALAIKFVKENLKEWGAREIIVAGQSAGAWLSLMLCLNNEYLNSVSLSPQDICAWIIDSAQTTSHYNVLKYEQKEDVLAQRINEFAPLYYVNKNTSFSKMLLVFYQEDMPCRYEEACPCATRSRAEHQQYSFVVVLIVLGKMEGQTIHPLN